MNAKAHKCPKCNSYAVSLQVLAWAEFERGYFAAFEPGESPHVPDGAAGICRDCGHEWTGVEYMNPDQEVEHG